MTAHHNVGSDLQKDNCIYCGNNLDPKKWTSEHVIDRHYKTNSCGSCGKEAKMEVDFVGDGTDSWAQPIEKQLEDNRKIQKFIGSPKDENTLRREKALLEKIIK